MKRRTNQHATLAASATLITLLLCAPLFAQSTAAKTDQKSTDASNVSGEAAQTPTATWADWSVNADSVSQTEANGNVVAKHAGWTIRAENARIRSAGSSQVIDFEGRVRLVKTDQAIPMVAGGGSASVDVASKSARFESSDAASPAFLTRASSSWILHAEYMVVRLDNGNITLERIGKTSSKNKSTRAAALR